MKLQHWIRNMGIGLVAIGWVAACGESDKAEEPADTETDTGEGDAGDSDSVDTEPPEEPVGGRTTISFNEGWLYSHSDEDDTYEPDFDDSDWGILGTDLGTSEVDCRTKWRYVHVCLDSRDFT